MKVKFTENILAGHLRLTGPRSLEKFTLKAGGWEGASGIFRNGGGTQNGGGVFEL